ncbi:MAG: hypothetical protein JWP25_1807 [Bradyrhizobium sp.]|nr:hypothetical protein [Bradyrhizobium sp.]
MPKKGGAPAEPSRDGAVRIGDLGTVLRADASHLFAIINGPGGFDATLSCDTAV